MFTASWRRCLCCRRARSR